MQTRERFQKEDAERDYEPIGLIFGLVTVRFLQKKKKKIIFSSISEKILFFYFHKRTVFFRNVGPLIRH